MKRLPPHLYLIIVLTLAAGCTSQKKLAYLNNLSQTGSEETFTMEIPDYKLQQRDVLFITVKTMDADGNINELLSGRTGSSGIQDVSGGYLSGFVVDQQGNIIIPSVGTIQVRGNTLAEARNLIQIAVDKVFNNSTVECKLQGFKVTILGEVNSPGTYIFYTNYLTVFEALGRTGGFTDYGDRSDILIIRMANNETSTFRISLQDKQLLSSDAYFLFPNDVLIIKQTSQKIFSVNRPTITFIITMLSSTISLISLMFFFYGK